MGSRRNTRRVTGARPGGFILIQRCTTHDRLRFRGPQHHAPQSGTRRVPALRFRGIMKPFSALSSKLKIIRATASAHSSTSSALPSVATKIDQYPYASLRLRSNVVIGNTRAIQNSFSPAHYLARVLPINAKGFPGPIRINGRKGCSRQLSVNTGRPGREQSLQRRSGQSQHRRLLVQLDHLRLAGHSHERSGPLRQLRSDVACWSTAATRAIRIRRA